MLNKSSIFNVFANKFILIITDADFFYSLADSQFREEILLSTLYSFHTLVYTIPICSTGYVIFIEDIKITGEL